MNTIIDDPLGISLDQSDWYTAGDIGEILGTTSRKVLLLIEQGILQPAVPSRGRGRARLFSPVSLVAYGIAFQLETVGLKPEFMRACMRAYGTLCASYDFRQRKREGKRSTSEFVSPNFLIFGFTGEGRGHCTARFETVGVGFPDPADEALDRLANTSLIINLRVLHLQIDRGVKAWKERSER